VGINESPVPDVSPSNFLNEIQSPKENQSDAAKDKRICGHQRCYFVSLRKRRRKNVSYALTYMVGSRNAQFSGVLAEFVAAVLVGVGELEDDE
jgi:hypothetical protein